MYPGVNAPTASMSRSKAAISASYAAGTNTYELSQIVSASTHENSAWTAGNVISFAFVAKMSHSFAGLGYDRGFERQ